jgi:L-serine dehydratase
MAISLFEIFKIGIGPSSSHTVGPMIAARRFVLRLKEAQKLDAVCRLRVDLYGSLAHTGKGHATDRAVILGLYGMEPQTADLETADRLLATVSQKGVLELLGEYPLPFSLAEDMVFRFNESLDIHTNGMTFTAFDLDNEPIRAENFYSIGGGFVVGDDGRMENRSSVRVPFAFQSAAELLTLSRKTGLSIWELMLHNERTLRAELEVYAGIDRIWQTMCDCMERGMNTTGILPGGLNVRRRASGLAARLRAKDQDADATRDPLAPLDWVAVFAMAVNEENAVGGRVVTAPTNGSAGVIPAVVRYYETSVPRADHDGIIRFFLTAAAIGTLYKENASISGAEVGCQGEVGVAASMAAGGLVAALGGNSEQVEHAAEIAMEHNLGMTCDPIGGLVQIPCIERNAMGAVKAINACRMAMNETEGHKITLDQVIETMYRTGLDMQSRYKETSLAGLALHVIEC